MRAALLFPVAALLVAACAGLAPVQREKVAVVPDTPFAADGRLSARHGKDAVTASYHWRHAPPTDEVELSTPLGQVVAQLTGDTAAGVARVLLADGRTQQAADWSTLTQRALGIPIPIAGLGSWMRGGPHAGTAHEAEVDPAGRVRLLRQDGWEIVYGYADDAAKRPSTLRLHYPDVEVRLSVDRLE